MAQRDAPPETFRAWHAARASHNRRVTGANPRRARGRRGLIAGVLWTPDPANAGYPPWLATADGDHLLTMWHVGDKLEIREHALQPASVIAAACGLLTRDFDDSEWNQYFVGEARRPTCPGRK